MVFQRLESFGQLRDVDVENGRVSSVISTGDIARDGAIIESSGWDFSNYDLNPVVLWMHDAGGVPFARTIEHKASKNKLVAKAQFDLDDPFGVTLLRKIEQGYVNATSVRWLPKRTEIRKVGKGKEEREVLVFLEQELLEWSFVTIPADPKALIVRADGEALSLADYFPEGYPPRTTPLWEPLPVWEVRLPEEPPENEELKRLEGRMVSHLARRLARPNTTELIVAGLAKATGKTEEKIRLEMAEGGFAR